MKETKFSLWQAHCSSSSQQVLFQSGEMPTSTSCPISKTILNMSIKTRIPGSSCQQRFPMSFFIVFSTKLSNKFGYTNFIKICSVIYFLSYLVIYIHFSLVICTIFLLIIPITVNSMAFVPMYNSLWGYYPQNKSTVTGYALVSYGISGILLNIMFLSLVNPQNSQATLNDNGFIYFDQNVSDNLLPTVKIIYFIVALLFVIGAWMMKKEDEEVLKQQQDQQNLQQENGQNHYELKEQAQPEMNLEQPHPLPSSNNNQIQLHDLKHTSPGELISKYSLEPSSQPAPFSLRKYLLDWKFIIIFCNVLFIDLYASYLLNNFKLIYIEEINDDHFLGYCLVVNTVTALAGTFLWGCLGDYLTIGKTMLYVIAIDLVIKIFGIFSSTKPTLIILMFLLGFTSRAMSTISGPGLIQVFGLKIGTQLLPIKALAVIGSMILVPILQLIFLGFLTPFQFMTALITINFFLLALTLYFIKNTSQEKTEQTQHKKQQP